MKRELIAIVGPTASGKTRKAVGLSRETGGEIISGDSRQVYRDMTIGTGKDVGEYGDVPVHLIDICEAGEKYNLHRFLADCARVIGEVRQRGHLPVLCGGSGMYVEAVLNGLVLPDVPADPELRSRLSGHTLEELTAILSAGKRLHNTTDVDTVARAIRAIEIMEYYKSHPEEAARADVAAARRPDALIVGIEIDRETRRRRITERLHARLDEGMVEEVQGLLDRGISPEDLIYYGLEYKYLTLYLTGQLSRAEMVSGLETAIHQFAKRQMTWFRGMERRGHTIHWLPWDMPQDEFNSEVLRLAGCRGE